MFLNIQIDVIILKRDDVRAIYFNNQKNRCISPLGLVTSYCHNNLMSLNSTTNIKLLTVALL